MGRGAHPHCRIAAAGGQLPAMFVVRLSDGHCASKVPRGCRGGIEIASIGAMPLAEAGKGEGLKKLAPDHHFPCLGPWKIRAVYLFHGRVGGVALPVRSTD